MTLHVRLSVPPSVTSQCSTKRINIASKPHDSSGFCKICCKVKGIESVATFTVLTCNEIAFVSVYLVGTYKKTVVSSYGKTFFLLFCT